MGGRCFFVNTTPRSHIMTRKRTRISMTGPRQVERVCEDIPPLKPGEVLIRTTLAAIKSGTEMTAFLGNGPFQSEQFDPDLRLFKPGSPPYPGEVGNMIVG